MTVANLFEAAPPASRDRDERNAFVRYLIGGSHQVLLTIRDAHGVMQTRLVRARGGRDRNSVRFVANPETAELIRRSPEVLLTYVNRGGTGGWLVLNGHGTVRQPTLFASAIFSLKWPEHTDDVMSEIEVRVISADLWE